MIDDRSSNTSGDNNFDEEHSDYDYEIFLDVCNVLRESEDAGSLVEYVALQLNLCFTYLLYLGKIIIISAKNGQVYILTLIWSQHVG